MKMGLGNQGLPVISFLFLLSTFGFSQVTTEQLYHGARSMAVAGSNVAHQNDVWAAFGNPAGLVNIPGISGSVAYERNLGLSYLPHSMAVAVLPTEKFGAVGITLDYLAVSYRGNTLSNEMAVAFRHGFYLQRDRNSTMAFGYGIKLLQVDYGRSAGPSGDGTDGIDLGRSQTVGIDIGILSSLRDRHWMGVRVLNINRPKLGQADTAVDLPRTIQLGMGYSPYSLVWTTFAMTRSAGHVTQYSAGIEYEIFPNVTILSGVQSNPNRLGLGLRIEMLSLIIDYGLLTHPILPITHQIAFGMSL